MRQILPLFSIPCPRFLFSSVTRRQRMIWNQNSPSSLMNAAARIFTSSLFLRSVPDWCRCFPGSPNIICNPDNIKSCSRAQERIVRHHIKRGIKSIQLGTCPAYPGYGQQCARVAGTLCGGEVQGTFALKLGNCQKCEFYTSDHYDKTYSRGEKDPLKLANNVSPQSR